MVIVGISIGSVTYRSSCQEFAPSIFAASINSPGIFWIPAIYDHRHTLAREGTVAAADGRRAVEMLDDKLLDLKGLGTNDRADFAQMNALNGFVDHKRLGKQAEHAVQTDTRAIQKGRDGHDADINQQQRAANLERRAALEDHGKNVRAARRGANIKDNGAAERRLLSGVAYALGGTLSRISGGIYLVTPSGVNISGEMMSQIESGGLSF